MSELDDIKRRLDKLEERQEDLVKTATQGETALRIFLWIGGVLVALGGLVAAFWHKISP